MHCSFFVFDKEKSRVCNLYILSFFLFRGPLRKSHKAIELAKQLGENGKLSVISYFGNTFESKRFRIFIPKKIDFVSDLFHLNVEFSSLSYKKINWISDPFCL